MQNEAPTARNLLTSVTDSIPNPSLRLPVIMRMKPGSSKIVSAIAAATSLRLYKIVMQITTNTVSVTVFCKIDKPLCASFFSTNNITRQLLH